jgi:hypothetical protein
MAGGREEEGVEGGGIDKDRGESQETGKGKR